MKMIESNSNKTNEIKTYLNHYLPKQKVKNK